MLRLPPTIVVAGPTGAGKTELGIELAEHFNGEIVNSDSMQVYRYLDIGTAKPTAGQRAQVPHHMLDCIDPDVAYNAGLYAKAARAAANRIHGQLKPVFLTGGTGLYIRAFLEGLLSSPGRDDPYRKKLQEESKAAAEKGDHIKLHRKLNAIDPLAAEGIHPHDLRRTIRALELLHSTGEKPSKLRREHGFKESPYRTLYLVIDCGRSDLHRKIDQRCDRMIEEGLLREVRDLRRRGFGPHLPSMRAIGYRHMQPVVDGLDTLSNVRVAMSNDTRRLARRQRTWFRRVPRAHWIHPNRREEIARMVERFLAT